jgi:hypothetical protein
MLEQIKAAFPKAGVLQNPGDGRFVVDCGTCYAYISYATAEGLWTAKVNSYWGTDITLNALSWEDLSTRLAARLRKELQALSQKTRTALSRPHTIPPPTVPPPEGFAWVQRDKNKWSAWLGNEEIFLRYSKSYGFFEYSTSSGFKGRVDPNTPLQAVLILQIRQAEGQNRSQAKRLNRETDRLEHLLQLLGAKCLST